MASSELAAILARRRAKAGGESDPPMPAVETSAPPPPETAPSATRSSIAERIARLKQQSAAASAANPAPAPPRFNHPQPVAETPQPPEQPQSVGEQNGGSAASEPVDTAAVAAAQEAAGIKRASSKIQQLQGSLGINVNPFGRPGGPTSGGYRKPSGVQRESIMSTGEEQYGHTQHAMGVAMPGMTGSAIPMPGLAKGGFRLPGMAPDGADEQAPAASLDESHATMARVAGPKRRGPTRPPPGAFRIPNMAAPIIDNVEPSTAPPTEAAAAPVSAPLPSTESAPAVVHQAEPVTAKAPEAPVATNLFGSPAVTPPVSAPAPTPVAFTAPTPVVKASPPPVAVQKLPEPELMPAMKPYHIEDDDPYAPKYKSVDVPYAPAGFPSALMANFSMDELTLDDKPKPSASKPTESASLFGTSSAPVSKPISPPHAVAAPEPTPAPVTPVAPTPIPQRAPSPTPAPVYSPAPAPVQESVPAPVLEIPAPTPVMTPAPAVVAPTLAPEPVPVTPTPAPAPVPVAASPAPVMAPGATSLFGAAAAQDDDDSSESDWSDDDDKDDGPSQPMLFGAQMLAPKPAVAAAPSPVLVTPSQPTPELHQAPAPISGNLFGEASSSTTPAAVASSAPAPGFVQATPQAAIPPTPYGSLFGGAVSSSDSDSDSDSDDDSGLFGTGLPSKR